MFQLMMKFDKRNLQPLVVPPDHILKYMLQSGEYMPAHSWGFGRNQLLHWQKSQVLFNMMTQGTERTTIDEVRTLFFAPGTGEFDTTSDHLWQQSYQQIQQRVRDLRAG